jgi:hypothetical protein
MDGQVIRSSMSRSRRQAIGVAGFLASIMLATPASPAEPRPWLCRQIPVFSGSAPMTWHATRRGAGHWLMIFMRYDPAGGHDGFTVVSTHRIDGQAEGLLDAGRWYAVAQYNSGGHWICPGNASAAAGSSPGSISNLCYGEDEGGCDVRLIVKARDASVVP